MSQDRLVDVRGERGTAYAVSLMPSVEAHPLPDPSPTVGVDECMHGLEETRQTFASSAVGLLSRECERSLEHVATIPRLYRRTNKEVREGRGGEGD